MFISTLDLFKRGIGPSSSHTVGPMVAALAFLDQVRAYCQQNPNTSSYLECVLKGSLAYTGQGHGSDKALILGLHGYAPQDLSKTDVDALLAALSQHDQLDIEGAHVSFQPAEHIVFDKGKPLPQHPNAMVFNLYEQSGTCLITQTYFSVGGGFICTLEEIEQVTNAEESAPLDQCPYPFDSAQSMLEMADKEGLSIAQMKRANELSCRQVENLDQGLLLIWQSMQHCVEAGLSSEGILPGGLEIARRAKQLHQQLLDEGDQANINDWLCAYAMAVNEENAAGHAVVTAPTNGAAGVIPAVLYYMKQHQGLSNEQIQAFLLTAAAIGGLVKYKSSISGAEVGCQGEVGVASAMAAAGLCAVRGGTPAQVENAAEIALEHHLGMTCDPVQGLVQVPCIERNGFGAIKAYTAASLALRGDGEHFMPLDSCIAAMKQTGEEMSSKFKETSLGGLAVSFIDC